MKMLYDTVLILPHCKYSYVIAFIMFFIFICGNFGSVKFVSTLFDWCSLNESNSKFKIEHKFKK
jgi:hypothetical protein